MKRCTVAPSWESIFPAAAISLVTKRSSWVVRHSGPDAGRQEVEWMCTARQQPGQDTRLGQRVPGLIYVFDSDVFLQPRWVVKPLGRRRRIFRGIRLYISNVSWTEEILHFFFRLCYGHVWKELLQKKVFTDNIWWETTLKVVVLKTGTTLRYKQESFEGHITGELELSKI